MLFIEYYQLKQRINVSAIPVGRISHIAQGTAKATQQQCLSINAGVRVMVCLCANVEISVGLCGGNTN